MSSVKYFFVTFLLSHKTKIYVLCTFKILSQNWKLVANIFEIVLII